MEASDEIRKMAEGLLKDSSHFIVEVSMSKGNPKKLVIAIDGDRGVSIDDCADLSRELSKTLDETNLIEDAFVLEVSTPGLDQPLRNKRQYVKNIGRNVRVRTRENTVEGKLEAVGDEKIQLLQQTGKGKKKEEKAVEILFNDIEKTLVLVSFK